MKFGLTRRGQKALSITLFLSFVIIGLFGTRWQGAFIQPWAKIDINLSSAETDTAAPYMLPLGDINGDQYPETLIYDGVETSKICFANWTYEFPSTKDELINLSIGLLSSVEYFSYYNYSGLGIYSLIGGVDSPTMLVTREFENKDILFCKQLYDINGDSIPEIFVGLAAKMILPDPELYGYSNMKNLLLENHWLFEELFILENSSWYAQITPNYIQYDLVVLDGSNLATLDTSERSELGIEMECPIDIIILNKTDYESGATAVLLTSTISSIRTIDEFSRSIINNNGIEYNHSLYGLNFDDIRIEWEKQPSDLGEQIYQLPGWYIDLNPGHANVTINNAYSVEIKPFGSEYVLKYRINEATVFDGFSYVDDWGINDTQIFGVYDGDSGENIWFGNFTVEYLTKNVDTIGSGFGQVFGYYQTATKINVILLNSSKGSPISKAVITENSSRLITASNFDFIRFKITDDDIFGNDGYRELMIVAINGAEHKEDEDYSGDHTESIQIARLGLNTSNDVKFVISSNHSDAPFSFFLPGGGEFYLENTQVDFDQDGVLDYVLYQSSFEERRTTISEDSYSGVTCVAVSGSGVKLHRRYFEGAISSFVEEKFSETVDFRDFSDLAYFFHDPNDENRVGVISLNTNEFVYVQDMNIFDPDIGFIDYFIGANIIVYVLIGLAAFSLIIATTQVKRKREIIEEYIGDTVDNEDEIAESRLRETGDLNKVVLVSLIISLLIVSATTYFFTVSIDLTIGYTDIVISPEGQLIWFLILYPGMFGLLAVLPDLFNLCAPIFAEKIFINGQKAFFKPFVKTERKDYRILVVDMKEKDHVSSITRISRMLLPFLISITIGITIYQGLGEDGFIYKAFSSSLIDHPLTNPNVLGIMTDEMTTADDIWVEIGKFARYCILPMIITYAFTALLIPGAWLLDDAGVCYYQQALKYREISDVDSISKWTLSIVSGLFGFTAIVSFVTLFQPMLTQVDELIYNIGALTEDPALFGVIILISALIIFPILIGIVLMFAAMRRMEEMYDINTEKLYKRMEKQGIDTTPHDLSKVLDATIPREESNLFYGLKLENILDNESNSSEEVVSEDDYDDDEQVSDEERITDDIKIKPKKIKKIDFESKYEQYANDED